MYLLVAIGLDHCWIMNIIEKVQYDVLCW